MRATPVSRITRLSSSPRFRGPLLHPVPYPVFGGTPPGVDLSDAAVTVCRAGSPLNAVCNDAAINPVYSSNNINGCGGANWFAQAAEDARKTIWYLHNWRLPVNDY